MDHLLDGFIDGKHPNFSKLERQALKDLRENKSLTLKPTDKGGALVIMNQVDYVKEVNRQLNDTDTYSVSHVGEVIQLEKLIDTVISEALTQNIIDEDLYKYLKKEHAILPVFYVLPKIHKSLENPPGRPIVASTDSVLQPISVFLDRVLQPLVIKTQSFIWDSKNVLRRITELSFTGPIVLFTWDVTSLYTSIPNREGMTAIQDALLKHLFPEEHISFLMKLVEIVLHNNIFLFGDTVYKQCRGTTMGSNMAPAYANLYMDAFENQFIYPHQFFINFVHTWWRYIDDVFGIWTGTETDLTFLTQMNTVNAHIKFTMISNPLEINFLDLTLRVEGTHLVSDLFVKPTDRNSLLHYSSFHPESTLNSLPRSQFTRVIRNVSNPDIRDDRLQQMINKFSD
uniref:Reverse transcriptase domain-containing protein n=1 Tax=Leptobrachium leishanense TaxID=445787 RepID=A0A8C5PDK2_9ANUR